VKPKPKQKPNKSRPAAKSHVVSKVKTRRKPMTTDPRTPPHTPPQPAKPPPPAAKAPDNIGQDPNHPANKTLSPERPPAPRSAAEGFNVPPEELMTAQESDQSGEVPGVGPVSPSEVSPGPVETIEEQGIGPRTPYPTGDPPQPSELTIRGQGIKGVTDKPASKPGEAKAPAGTTYRPPPPGPMPTQPRKP
jgi:hypothetical protein